ncbi:MAG: protein phosphatase 2C domain-containing protein [Flavobacteriales bacterium]
MHLKTWEDCAFISKYGNLGKHTEKSNLNFSIGAITKQGNSHIEKGISNQDAINMAVGKNYIIGILCDGCTSTHKDLYNSFSQNHFGSILISNMLINLCEENIVPRKNKMKPEKFIKWLSEQTQVRLKQCLKTIRKTNNIDHAISNLFSSTIIGFVVREKQFFVFHFGDGIVQINTKQYDLSSNSEQYFSSCIIKPKGAIQFNLIEKGATENLENIMVASDGFKNDSLLKSNVFNKFITKQLDSSKPTFQDLIPEMHLKVLNPFLEHENKIRHWPKDDSSLILLRKKKTYVEYK